MRRLAAFVLACLVGFWLGIRVAQGPAGAPVPVSPTQEAAARAYLDANLPAMPEGWAWDLFAPEQGVALEVGRAPAVGAAKGTVLYVPGFTAPLDMYGHELTRLAEAGWAVAAISPRGQGRSARGGPDGEMGWVDDHRRLAEDVAAFVETLEPPVAVLAVSMGGHVALRMAAEVDPEPVAAYALVAPMVAIRTDPFPDAVARGLSRGFELTGLGATYALGRGPWDDAARFDDPAALARGTDCARDPARAHLREALFALEPELRVGGPSAAWVARTFRSQDLLARAAPDIDAPVWMALAGEDRVVDTDAAAAMCAAMDDCAETRFEGARHCMFEDAPETREALIDGALAFFEAARAR